MRLRLPATVLLTVAVAHPVLAQNEITVIAPGGIRAALDQLLPRFEKKSGSTVNATFGSGGGTREQIVRGTPCDVAIVQEPYEDVLASGNVVASTETRLARIALGIAVRAGAPKPSIGTSADLRGTLLDAKSVAYPDAKVGAAAGARFDEALQKLGMAVEMEPKLKRTPNGTTALQMVAKGEAEIGISFISEMNAPGIEIVGPFPSTVLAPTGVVGFSCSHGKDPAGAKALLQHLSSSEAVGVYEAKRMMSR